MEARLMEMLLVPDSHSLNAQKYPHPQGQLLPLIKENLQSEKILPPMQ